MRAQSTKKEEKKKIPLIWRHIEKFPKRSEKKKIAGQTGEQKKEEEEGR
jgi:hypothetical protein